MTAATDTTRLIRAKLTSFTDYVTTVGIAGMSAAKEIDVENTHSILTNHQTTLSLSTDQTTALQNALPVAVPVWAIADASVSILRDISSLAHAIAKMSEDTDGWKDYIGGVLRSSLQLAGDGTLLYQGIAAVGNAASMTHVFAGFAIKYGVEFLCALSKYSSLYNDGSEKEKQARADVIDKGFKFAGFLAVACGVALGGHLVGFALLSAYAVCKVLVSTLSYCCLYAPKNTMQFKLQTASPTASPPALRATG